MEPFQLNLGKVKQNKTLCCTQNGYSVLSDAKTIAFSLLLSASSYFSMLSA